MTDPLSSVQDRFDRAQEHFETTKTRLRDYYAENPYVIYGNTDFYANAATERVLYAEAPNERFNTIIGEMLHNLRSALDHLARVFVKTNGGDARKRFTFPALDPVHLPTADANGIRPGLLRECGSNDVLRFLDGLQPYQFGDDFFLDGLWILHRLAIIDRHIQIVPDMIGLTKYQWSHGAAPPRGKPEWKAHTIRSDENGAELELRLDKPNPYIEGTATLQIVAHQPGEEGINNPNAVPLIDLLNDANNKAREIIDRARSEFFS
jgi:hypothetical protein